MILKVFYLDDQIVTFSSDTTFSVDFNIEHGYVRVWCLDRPTFGFKSFFIKDVKKIIIKEDKE